MPCSAIQLASGAPVKSPYQAPFLLIPAPLLMQNANPAQSRPSIRLLENAVQRCYQHPLGCAIFGPSAESAMRV